MTGPGQTDLIAGLNAHISKIDSFTEAVEQTGQKLLAALDMQQRYGGGLGGGARDIGGLVRKATNDFTAGQTKGAQPNAGPVFGSPTLGGIQQGLVQNAANLLAGQTGSQPGQGGNGTRIIGPGGSGGGGGGGTPPPGGGGPGGPGGPGGGSGAGGGSGGSGGAGGGTGGGRPGGGPGGGPPGAPPAPGGPSGGPMPGGTGALTGVINGIPFLGTANDMIAEMRSQMNKNAYYQNIEGGSNAYGFVERGREELYRWSTFPYYNEEEARQAFKGVSRIGYTGTANNLINNSRSQALKFISSGKFQYGADVSESLGTLEVASRDSRVSLQLLSRALKDVSDTAGKAGVNAQMMREQFTNLLAVGIQQGYGAGALGFARSTTELQASYGRSFESTDFSGRLSTPYTYRIASGAGLSPTQYTSIQQTDPTRAAQLRTRADAQTINQLFSSEELSWIQAEVAKYGGKSVVAKQPDIVAQIAQDFYIAHPNRNIDADTMVLSSLSGIKLTNQTAMQWVIEQVAGNTEGAQAQKDQDKAGFRTASKEGLDQFRSSGKASDLNRAIGLGKPLTLGGVGQGGYSKTEGAYVAQAEKTGKESGVIEALLTNLRKQGVDLDTTKVVVNTSSGRREMTLADAITNFPNEVAAGKVTFSQGDLKGQTSSDVAGVADTSQDTSEGWKKEAQDPNKGKLGTSFSGTLTPNDGKTNVLVGLTEEAKKFFKIVSLIPGLGPKGDADSQGAPPDPADVLRWHQ